MLKLTAGMHPNPTLAPPEKLVLVQIKFLISVLKTAWFISKMDKEE